jgi:hypothetical protein
MLVPEDARAELDREQLLSGEAETLPEPAVPEVPEDVLAELDAEARAQAEVPGDDGRRPAPLDDVRERYRQA